jgi:hypothetical protein
MPVLAETGHLAYDTHQDGQSEEWRVKGGTRTRVQDR